MRQTAIILLLGLMGFMKTNAQFESFEYTVDSSLYKSVHHYVLPGPLSTYGTAGYDLSLYAFSKKNSDLLDIFSFKGKIASITVPQSIKDSSLMIYLSQNFIDEDSDWECIVNSTSGIFYVFDNDGTVLLSDSATALYGFDGNNTYIIDSRRSNKFTFKAWQIRTNVTSSSPQSLSKNKNQSQRPIITYGPSGSYRVTFQPVAGGKTSIEIFDLMGRLTFSRVFDKKNQTTTCIVPAESVPQSPFITRTSNRNCQKTQAVIPVRK